MVCKNCGAQLTEGHAFCSNCGASVEAMFVKPESAGSQEVHSAAQPEATAAFKPETQYTGPADASFKKDTYASCKPGQQPQSSPGTTMEPDQSFFDESDVPAEYKPVSMWGYFGYELLFNIPLVGLVFLLIYSFGGTKNKNVTNYARAHFCWMIVLVIILVVIAAAIGASQAYNSLLQ